jgi:Fe-S cluster assembly protein SufB
MRQLWKQISAKKGEPQWMLDFRLRALKHFQQRPNPNLGARPFLADLNEIYYYVSLPRWKDGS